MPKLEYGDICFHEVTEKTGSRIRTLIRASQAVFFPSARQYKHNVHASIYIGKSKSDDIAPEVTPHMVVEMDQPGLKINPILNHEKIHIVRCKNQRLAILAADLALSWALRSDIPYAYSNLVKTVLPRISNEFPRTLLTQLKHALFKPLPTDISFTCTAFIISLYNIAADLIETDPKEYADVSHRVSPSEFRQFFDNHDKFIHDETVVRHPEYVLTESLKSKVL